MREVDANREAWGLLSRDHYVHYRERLRRGAHDLNAVIRSELGDLDGKNVIHLQCNTGADTMLLAARCAAATGVDLVPGNIDYARRMAIDLNVENVRFIQSDLMSFAESHHDRYDAVFTSEGAIGWLPDLRRWGRTIRSLCRPGGFFYAFDSHPFMLSLDETKLKDGVVEVKYPYFGKVPDESTTIGGYASEPKPAKNYFWQYTVSDLIDSLVEAGMRLDWFHEHDGLFYDLGGMTRDADGLYYYDHFRGRLPMSFSLRASVS